MKIKPAWSDEMCAAFARAYDREDAATRGEPDPWSPEFEEDSADDEAAWRAERIACVRAGLAAMVMAALKEKRE